MDQKYIVLHFTFWLIWFISQRALYNHASCVVVLRRRWHQCWHLTPPLATGLNIEALYLVYLCIYVPHQIFSSDL